MKTRQTARVDDTDLGINPPSWFPKADLVICDWPFNLKMPYEAYADDLKPKEYLAKVRNWLTLCYDALAPNGTIWLFANDNWDCDINIMARREFGLHFRRHVIWAFTFGQKAQTNFTRSHTHLLYFTKSKKDFTFNLDDVKVPSARLLVYNDKRAEPTGKPPDDTWMLLKNQMEPFMTPNRSVWLDSRINGNSKEREGYSPNQVPIAIMARIIAATCPKGGYVLDPFCGTGSSGLASLQLGRNWYGCDTSETCIEEAKKKLSKAAG